jgi:hypothetical protein
VCTILRVLPAYVFKHLFSFVNGIPFQNQFNPSWKSSNPFNLGLPLAI